MCYERRVAEVSSTSPRLYLDDRWFLFVPEYPTFAVKSVQFILIHRFYGTLRGSSYFVFSWGFRLFRDQNPR